MRYTTIVLFLITSLVNLYAFQPDSLSEKSEVSLLTISPGNELYMSFGHSAVRIKDPASGLDRIYNYGTFSFDEPGFYLKFCQGKLDYILSAYPYKYAYILYTREQRKMVEQTFALTLDMRQAVYEALETNHLPENRRYRYDFFFDNCATRILDIFEKALGPNFKIYEADDRNLTFRNYIDQYLVPFHWSDFGIDLVLGAKTDHQASAREAMFLPDYLYEGFDKATIVIDEKEIPFVSSRKVIIDYPPVTPASYHMPWLVTIAILLIAGLVTFLNRTSARMNWIAVLYDSLLFGVMGILGVVIALLWFATDHKVTPANYNILWIWPTHLFILPFLLRKQLAAWLGGYLKVYLAFLAIVLLGWFFIPQQLHPAIIPLVLALGLRSWSRLSPALR
ncbi:MAG: DUF4105 domain-containing protein [Calditrichia bacterium]